ncbi:rust resistance kinase Lr10-like [Papaver somniferum]|nr:rust resistance kinase Lr10-like [Papaver somniferum]
MNWNEPQCSNCETNGRICGYYHHNSSHAIGCFRKPKEKKLVGTKIAISVSVGLFIIVLLVLIIFIKIRKEADKEEKENQLRIEQFLENNALKPTRYSHVELKKMTNKFQTKLGHGGYGSVFEGNLTNGIQVAVKILDNSVGSNSGEEFVNEVGTIGRIHHLNVVRILGFCVEGSTRALIYEFMKNKSLDKFIFPSGKDKTLINLGWAKLQEIATGIARGMEYLHQGCDQRILHFDIKPQNILLDHNFTPKISDFGLAKLCSKDTFITISMAAARGTMGYIAPEVFSRNFGIVSYKSDVYSFGMLLLEMVEGKKNTEITMETHGDKEYSSEKVYNRLNRGEDLGIEVEAKDLEIVKKLITVALWCIQWNPIDRPSMNDVLHMLEGSTRIFPCHPILSP